MAELEAVKAAVDPSDQLYVADAMTGQDAIKSAGEFNRRVGVTGVVLSKLDGDARGGAALSVVSVVGVPIAFVGSGERLEDLEVFHPDRVVSRVLGMGDVLSLIEKAEQAIDVEDAARLEEKLRNDAFTLEDFRDQLRTIRKMGPLESIIGMIPGMSNIKELAENKPDEKQLGRVEAIISSMTDIERRNHQVINGSRRKRIARGSGTSVEEVNRLLKQFIEMRKNAEVPWRDWRGWQEETPWRPRDAAGHGTIARDTRSRRVAPGLRSRRERRTRVQGATCWQSGCVGWDRRSGRSSGWWWPDRRPPATAASSRSSGATTRERSPRRLRWTASAWTTGCRRAPGRLTRCAR